MKEVEPYSCPTSSGCPPDRVILDNGREDAVNRAYLYSRMDVYAPEEDLMKKLDDLCYSGTMVDVATPLVLIGVAGSGKTALLANWVKKREEEQKTSTVHGGEKEIIFYHNAGSSRDSVKVKVMLHR